MAVTIAIVNHIDPQEQLPADPSPYLDEVTSEHQDKPKFMATVETTVQPIADTMWLEQNYYLFYDLDYAVGKNLDAVGMWVGRDRYLPVPITAYFSWDTDNLGWDQAVWKRDFDPDSGFVTLPDELYRLLLRSVILANHWDGTIPGAYEVWKPIWSQCPGYTFVIQDYEDGSMAYGLIGPAPPDQIMLGYFTFGEIDTKPAGVELDHFVPSMYPAGVGGTPVFGFDSMTPNCAGWDVGAWADFTVYKPE
jgi:hypothetical protein